MPNENCPVCEGSLETPIQISESGNRKSINCLRCGSFTIADEGLFKELGKDDRIKWSAWFRTKYRSGSQITPENFEHVCQDVARYDYGVSEKQLLLLRLLESRTTHPGERVKLNEVVDYPAIWAHNGDELRFHRTELKRRGLIWVSGDWKLVSITTSGWNFLHDNAALTNVGNQAFVAMSFSESMKPVFSEGIRPALDRAGYRAYRVDFDEHIQRIDAKIEHEIRNSVFVVADVTEQKQGVYFEAGIAIGLGLPVIWSVNEGEIGDVHFDTRQYNHVVWKDAAQLQEALYHRVSVLIRTPE